MKRLLIAVGLAGVLVAAPLAQVAPVQVVPGFTITTCPPSPNALAVCSLFTSTTAASNVSTGETDLITYSLPGGALSTTNQKVRITAWGTLANTANTKTVKVYFGATAVMTVANTNANVGWWAQAYVVRTGAATQIANANMIQASGWASNLPTTPTETLSGAVTIKVTGQSSAASGDVTAAAMLVEWVP